MSPLRILVVEDEGLVAEDLKRTLNNLGYAVPTTVLSGKGAIATAAEIHPDLVLMDIELRGGIDGVAAAEKISTRFDIPVVFLTAHGDEETLRRAKATGPFGYILKPFSERELNCVIETAAYRHQMERVTRESEKRLQRQNRTLVTLTSRRLECCENLNSAMRDITENAANTLQVERASVWLLNEEQSAVHCLDMYDRSTNYHSNSHMLSVADSPAYFRALREERTIAAHEAQTDLRTRELSETYLVPFGITSMLDAPIRLGERRVGVVRHEHVGSSRQWMLDEQSFAGSIADLVSLTMETFQRKQAEKELQKTHDELELRVQLRTAELARSNADLEQFAYVVSHDLQDPLRMVSSFMKLLERQYCQELDDKAREYIGFAVDGTKWMQQLINDLLTYSHVGPHGKEFEPVDSNAVVRQVVDNLQVAIDSTHAQVTRDELPTVTADPTQLVQLFQNLIGNAIKFCGRDVPRIHVSAEQAAEQWVFSVRDHGIGIDPKHAQRVFSAFGRLHSRDEYSGAGIGLAVCRRIVDRHGGRIWFESEPGQGTKFFFTFRGAGE